MMSWALGSNRMPLDFPDGVGEHGRVIPVWRIAGPLRGAHPARAVDKICVPASLSIAEPVTAA
jgi:hypothetical protein